MFPVKFGLRLLPSWIYNRPFNVRDHSMITLYIFLFILSYRPMLNLYPVKSTILEIPIETKCHELCFLECHIKNIHTKQHFHTTCGNLRQSESIMGPGSHVGFLNETKIMQQDTEVIFPLSLLPTVERKQVFNKRLGAMSDFKLNKESKARFPTNY